MKKNLRDQVVAAVGVAVALAFSSCAYAPYDPNYAASVSSYGDGYGYGSSSFSTSVFIGTGNPRWGYDPYCYSYYDYHRRCYYDPYLNGYYPLGYRPPVVYGVPHPYGWSPGRSHIHPPSRISNVTIVNYRNRESSYRSSNYDWARQTHQQAPRTSRQQEPQPTRSFYHSRPETREQAPRVSRPQEPQPTRSLYHSRPETRPRPTGSPDPRASQESRAPNPQSSRPDARQKDRVRPPSRDDETKESP